MSIPVKELKVNDIVLFSDNGLSRRSIVKDINGNDASIEYLDMQTGKMIPKDVSVNELKPINLLEPTLCELGFEKVDQENCLDIDILYVLKRNVKDDMYVAKTDAWHYCSFENSLFKVDERVLFLHELQNYMSFGKKCADCVDYDKFVKLTNPYGVLPYERK